MTPRDTCTINTLSDMAMTMQFLTLVLALHYTVIYMDVLESLSWVAE